MTTALGGLDYITLKGFWFFWRGWGLGAICGVWVRGETWIEGCISESTMVFHRVQGSISQKICHFLADKCLQKVLVLGGTVFTLK